MRPIRTLLFISLLAAGIFAGLQACGKKDGFGIGGNVTFKGSGS